MTGWKGLNSEHLKFLIANSPLLSRLDLSSINVRICFVLFFKCDEERLCDYYVMAYKYSDT
jgi:hypothetical protein